MRSHFAFLKTVVLIICAQIRPVIPFFEILNGIDSGKKILFIPLDMYERLIENNHKFTNSIFENLIVFVVGTDLVRHVKIWISKNAYLINEDKVLRIDTIDQIGPLAAKVLRHLIMKTKTKTKNKHRDYPI